MKFQGRSEVDLAQPGLSTAAFKTALATGHGRALAEVHARGQLIDRDAVLDACIHNRAYDPQVEGSRAGWMMELLDAAGEAESLWPEILAAFSTTEDGWDLDQLCDLAVAFGQRGYAGAREAVYEIINNPPDPSAPWLGEAQIVRLDGIDGFLWAAERREPETAYDDWEWTFAELVGWSDEICGAEPVDKAVEEAAKAKAKFETFLEGLREYRRRQQLRVPPRQRHEQMQTITANQVIEEIATTHPEENRFRFRHWGKFASDRALQQVAEAMFAEHDPGRLVKYLVVFAERALPRFDLSLVGLADHPNPEVQHRALSALAMNSADAVRSLALDQLGNGDITDGALRLLSRNYRDGDHLLIESALRPNDDTDRLHCTTMDLVEVFEENKSPDCVNSLLFAYEQTPCSMCRAGAVRILLDQAALPDELMRECTLDANENIRDMVKRPG